MPHFLFEVLIRLAVMLPTLMIVATLIWYACKAFGVLRTDAPIDPRNMRTWPLRIALIDAALFALTFAVVIVAIGESQLSAGVAAAASAIVAIGLAPPLLVRFAR